MTKWLLLALAAFQLLIAVLLILDWDSTVAGFAGKAPNRDAAEGAAVGALGVHVLMAVLYVVVAVTIKRQWARVVATILLAVNIIVGVAALFAIADQTPLNPVGIALAVITMVALWAPSRKAVATR